MHVCTFTITYHNKSYFTSTLNALISNGNYFSYTCDMFYFGAHIQLTGSDSLILTYNFLKPSRTGNLDRPD